MFLALEVSLERVHSLNLGFTGETLNHLLDAGGRVLAAETFGKH